MTCQTCSKEGLKSTLEVEYEGVTSLVIRKFYDEEGKEHIHDNNIYTNSYRCSNGHQILKLETKPCWCGWRPNKVEPIR